KERLLHVRTLSLLFVQVCTVGALGLTVLVGTSAVSVARPKTPIAQCSCMCVTSSGLSDRKSYNNPGASCGTFNDKACNMENAQTGVVETGKLTGCDPKPANKVGRTKAPTTGTRQQ